ncbi:GntR family transcriptional regulator [Mesorhizobium sp. BR1-1-16]|uniref:GntR family transcriptional regulator n=1 Tax=Mesorhizobium sp. BR1-1-16 TaxID=2876653 RepID=UPI001CCD22EE|nr:GntR family transcriptional regulator [Mesorhizobium sp. BR1-1-16]
MSSSLPQYRRIADALVAAIRSGELEVGGRMPSERELSAEFGVSRMTARGALKALVDQGLVSSIEAKGYFVSVSRIDQRLQTLTSFSEDMRRSGRRSSSIVLAARMVPASGEVAARLAVAEGSAVFHLLRLRQADSVPVALEAAHIPESLAPGLIEAADFAAESLYATLRRRYGILPVEAEQSFEASAATESDAAILQVETGAPVLRLTRLSLSADGRPVEFVQSVYRGDRFTMRVRLAPGSTDA